jgi:hypothetical protein
MRLFESDAEPEAWARRIWNELVPARPLAECPGAWELKGPPGERGRWSYFGVNPGDKLAQEDAILMVRVRRYDERNPRSRLGGAPLLLDYVIQTRAGIHIHTLWDAVVTPLLPGNAASLIVTVWDSRGHLAEGIEVRAR